MTLQAKLQETIKSKPVAISPTFGIYRQELFRLLQLRPQSLFGAEFDSDPEHQFEIILEHEVIC